MVIHQRMSHVQLVQTSGIVVDLHRLRPKLISSVKTIVFLSSLVEPLAKALSMEFPYIDVINHTRRNYSRFITK